MPVTYEQALEAFGQNTNRNRFQAFCPLHANEKSPALSVSRGHNGTALFHCFSGCSDEKDFYKNMCRYVEGDSIEDIKRRELHRKKQPLAVNYFPLSLDDFAKEKVFDVDKLKTFSVGQGFWGGVPAVRFSYIDEKGDQVCKSYRLREEVKKRDGSKYTQRALRQDNANGRIPYGVWKLAEARKKRQLWIVEGETDCLTLWLHDIPALGIQGASRVDDLFEAHYVENIKDIYVLDEQDLGAETFVSGVARALERFGWQGQLHIVAMPDGLKDANDLYLENRDFFKEKLAIQTRQAVSFGDWSEDMQKKKAAIGEAATGVVLDLDKKRIETDKNNISDRAIIFKSVQERHQNKVVMDALRKHQEELNFFQRGELLVKVIANRDGLPEISTLNASALRALITNHLDFYREKQNSEGKLEIVPAKLNDNIVSNVLHSQDHWSYRSLKYVSNVPTILDDGTIITETGYNAETETYYQFKNELNLDVPDTPTDDDVKNAVDIIKNRLLVDVLFEDKRAFANGVAFFLTPLLTAQLDGVITPIFLLEANKRSSGKTTLYEMCSLLAYGSVPSMTPYPSREEELEKSLLSSALADKPIIAFDNIKRKIDSAALAAFVTSSTYSGRIMRSNMIATCPKRSLVVMSANNPKFDEDMATRFCRISLSSQSSRPDRRDYQFNNILDEIKENRSLYLSAFLTLIKTWIIAGKPIPKDAPKTRFRDWSNKIAGILSIAGIPFIYEDENARSEEEEEWELFLQVWAGNLSDWKTTRELLAVFNPAVDSMGAKYSPFVDILPEAISVKLTRGFSDDNASVARRVGKVLAEKVNTPYGDKNYRIIRKRSNKGMMYNVAFDCETQQSVAQSKSVAEIQRLSENEGLL
jgi:DNA primase